MFARGKNANFTNLRDANHREDQTPMDSGTQNRGHSNRLRHWKWPSRNSGFVHWKVGIFHSFLYVYQRISQVGPQNLIVIARYCKYQTWLVIGCREFQARISLSSITACWKSHAENDRPKKWFPCIPILQLHFLGINPLILGNLHMLTIVIPHI